jgi:hypothetical protein
MKANIFKEGSSNKSGDAMKHFGQLIAITLILIFASSIAFADETIVQPFSVERQFGELPQIQGSQKQFPIASNPLSAIEPIRVTDPYVTPGSPFVIEFTLENIGDELGYPFNQIPLTPDNYTLVMMADNQYDKIILPNGSTYDLWGKMNAWEQFSFVIGTSLGALSEEVSSVNGKVCKQVNVWSAIPGHLQDDITVANGGKRPSGLLNWSCIKLVEENYFNQKVNSLCKGVYDAKCLSEINSRTYVGDTVMVALTSTVPNGTCMRTVDKGFWEALGGAITTRMNAVECGIGDEGIKPGESRTFTFIGLVPNDTPVLSPTDFTKLSEVNNGVTQSASCLSSDFPESCHTIYAGVYPTAHDNLIKVIVDVVGGSTSRAITAIIGTLYHMDFEFGKDQAMASGGITNQVVGKPIYEGRGIFYVVGAGLRGSIQIILMLALITGAITGASFRRKTGA